MSDARERAVSRQMLTAAQKSMWCEGRLVILDKQKRPRGSNNIVLLFIVAFVTCSFCVIQRKTLYIIWSILHFPISVIIMLIIVT